jgi:hypothetical protein
VPIAEVQIECDDVLYRRLVPESHIKPDGTVASSAYKKSGPDKKSKVPDDEISVELARLTSPQESVNRAPRAGFCLGQLQVSVIEPLGLTVKHDPLDNNPAHTLILGNASMDTCAKLAEETKVIPDLFSC